MQNKFVICKIDKEIATLTFNREDKLHSFNNEFMDELDFIITNISKNSDIGCVIITGTGRSFCAGGDIFWEKSIGEAESKITKERLHSIQKTFNKIETLPQPVIAAINGFAIGGGSELAMACDIRIAAESAKFSHPETLLGTVAPLGGTQRLSRLIGLGRAKYMFFTGDRIDAKTALDWGLVDFCISDDKLMSFTNKIAKKITKADFYANSLTKKLVTKHYTLDLLDSDELDNYAICSKRQENKDQLKAFLNK